LQRDGIPSRIMALTPTRDANEADATLVAAGRPPDSALGPATARVPAAVSDEERYETLSVLGRGGMGEVRLCRDRRIGRDVAIKTAHDGLGADAEERFAREALVQARLEHPAFVPVYDVLVDERGVKSFAMKRVRGRTLREIIAANSEGRDAGPSRHRLLAAFVQLCLAVDYAHTRGVVHRDIKPENIMLGDFGEVLLLDWGIARLSSEPETDTAVSATADTAAAAVTREGAILGTLRYMSPEQVRGEHGSLDGRADVYSLGCVLFELLAKEPLHRAEQFASLVASTLSDPDARPSTRALGRDTAPELDAICVRATRPSRDERFATARSLAEAIERFLDGDRDAAARRARAAALSESARALLTSAGEDIEARVRAGREAAQALALDPRCDAARETLLDSIARPPAAAPPAVIEAVDAARRDSERFVLRGAAQSTFVVKALLVVLLLWVIPVFEPAVAWAAIAVGLASGVALWAGSRASDPERAGTLGVALMCIENGIFTRWTSPHTVNNMVAIATGLSIAVYASDRVRRGWYAMALSVVVVPTLCEMLGILRPTYIVGPRSVEIVPTLGAPLPVWFLLAHFVVIALSVGNGVLSAFAQARRVETRARSQQWLLERVLGTS
jgi:hypothetical protein